MSDQESKQNNNYGHENVKAQGFQIISENFYIQKKKKKKVSGGIWKLNFACHNEYHLYLALKISKEKMMLT